MQEIWSEWRGGIPGWTDGHRWVPVVAGGDGTEGDDNDTDDDTDDDDEEEEDNDTPDEDEIRDPKAYAKSLKDANERLARKLKKKDRDSQALADRLKELEDKDKDEATRKDETLNAVSQERDELGERVRQLEVENALLTREDLMGVPPRRRKLIVSAILPDLEVDDDGDSNIDDLLKDLKKDDPDLFIGKAKDDGSDDDDETSGNGTKRKQAPPKTGGAKKKKDADRQTDRASFEKRFPALRR